MKRYYRESRIELYSAQVASLLNAIRETAKAGDVDSVLSLSDNLKHTWRLLVNLKRKEGVL